MSTYTPLTFSVMEEEIVWVFITYRQVKLLYKAKELCKIGEHLLNNDLTMFCKKYILSFLLKKAKTILIIN